MANFCTLKCAILHLLTGLATLVALVAAIYTGHQLVTLVYTSEAKQETDLLVNHSLIIKEFNAVRNEFLHLLNKTQCLKDNPKVAFIKCHLEPTAYTIGSSDREFGRVNDSLKYYNLETFCNTFAKYQQCLLSNSAIACKKNPGYFTLASSVCSPDLDSHRQAEYHKILPRYAIENVLISVCSMILTLFLIECIRLVLQVAL